MTIFNETDNFIQNDGDTFVLVVKLLWLLSITIGGLILNASLIVLVKIKSELRRSSHLLLCSIAASNVICCTLVLPSLIVNELTPNSQLIGPVCEGQANVIQLWSVSNLYSIMFYCHDMSKSIRNPMPYRVASNRCTKCSIAFLWVLALLLSWLPIFGFGSYKVSPFTGVCDRNWYDEPISNLCVTLISFWLPFTLIIFWNIRIICSARSNLRNVHSLHEIMRFSELQIRRRSLFKILKTSIVVVGIVLLSLATHLVLIYVSAFYQTNKIFNFALTFTFYLTFAPILVYPYLFSIRNETLGKKLKNMFLKMRCCCSDIRKITPAVEIDENDYTENVSRRNSRTESLKRSDLKKFSLQSTSLFGFVKPRRDSTGSTILTPVDM